MSSVSSKLLLITAAALAATSPMIGLYDTPRVPQKQSPIDFGRNREKDLERIEKAEEKRRRRAIKRMRERLLREEALRTPGDKADSANWVLDGEDYVLRPEIIEHYRASVKRQLAAWVLGIAIHNREYNECCPDGSCCGSKMMPAEERLRFAVTHGKQDDEALIELLRDAGIEPKPIYAVEA